MSWARKIDLPSRRFHLIGVQDESLQIENAKLRELLNQAAVNTDRLRSKAGLAAIESQNAVRRQRLLVEELHHRAKNILAIVMAISSQSLKSAVTVEEGRIAIEARLLALGRAQDILLMVHQSSVQLSHVISTAIEPFNDQKNLRFVVNVNELKLAGDAILPLTLSLNELCTNAAKYGALSVPRGRVAIASDIDHNNQRFKLTWVETGGPLVREPTRRSFGSNLIRLLAAQLNADAHLRFEPGGVIYELDAPLTTELVGTVG